MSEPYEFWVSPKREDGEDFYRAYRKNIPGNHFMHVREVPIEQDLAEMFEMIKAGNVPGKEDK